MSGYTLAPIDPHGGPTFALGGRVVTMATQHDVLDDGVVYIRDGSIVAAQTRGAPAPDGFAGVKVLETKGTIYPGLIDLHDHLSYNALQLWDVPQAYTNRDQWAQGDTYRKLITGPMKVLAHTPRYVQAVVRYVESKCLVAGTTTTQGIALSSYAGIQHFYKGIVRNVEQTDESDLPEATSHISDVEAKDRAKFLARLKHFKCLLLHLSEGTDDAAHKHFEALQGPTGDWAVTDSLAGIHCVALTDKDFHVLAAAHASMVWSPLSNLLLYGKTANVVAAQSEGVTIGLGPDWSPSGSKNLLGELKIARLVSGGTFSDFELLSFATRNAAQILRWQDQLGTLEASKRADLLVVSGAGGDPHQHLFSRSEHDVELVVINGIPRYGTSTTMRRLLAEQAKDGGVRNHRRPSPPDQFRAANSRPRRRKAHPRAGHRPPHRRSQAPARPRQRPADKTGAQLARQRTGNRKRTRSSCSTTTTSPVSTCGRTCPTHTGNQPASSRSTWQPSPPPCPTCSSRSSSTRSPSRTTTAFSTRWPSSETSRRISPRRFPSSTRRTTMPRSTHNASNKPHSRKPTQESRSEAHHKQRARRGRATSPRPPTTPSQTSRRSTTSSC